MSEGFFRDDFYVNMNLSTEMELPKGENPFCIIILSKYVGGFQDAKFREKSEFVLEEERSVSKCIAGFP